MRVCENGKYRDMTAEEMANISSINPLERISELKNNLAESDYIACKIAEGAATKEEYAEQLEQRQKWREEINALEESICEITAEKNQGIVANGVGG